jgi:hypothetical protein
VQHRTSRGVVVILGLVAPDGVGLGHPQDRTSSEKRFVTESENTPLSKSKFWRKSQPPPPTEPWQRELPGAAAGMQWTSPSGTLR